MSRALLVSAVMVMALGAVYLQGQAPAAAPVAPRPAAPFSQSPLSSRPAPPELSVHTVLNKYCVTCHNERMKAAGLVLETMDVERVGNAADVWEKVARKFRTHEMPPPGRPRPDLATYGAVAARLESALDTAAIAKLNPGRVPVHRLSRVEYTNAIRDLLGLEVDGASLLTADEPDQQNFDNIASVLTVSPVLLEGYLSAASRISRLAVGDPTIVPVVETYKIPKGLVQDVRTTDDLPFGSQGGAAIRHFFPVDGEYNVKVSLKRELYYYIVGMGEPHLMDVRVDGVRVKRFTVGGEGKGMTAPESFAGNTQGDPEWETYMHTADAGLEVRVPVKAGMREVAVSFVGQLWEPEGVLQPAQRGFAVSTNELYYGHPAVDTISIGGPHRVAPRDGATESLSRRTVFVCRPEDSAGEKPCATKILSTLARRAYRRPITDAEIETLLNFYEAGRAQGGFEAGIQRGLRRILAAPSFLFRIEREPVNAAPGVPYRLSDLDLASRLSFFLWSSIPDDQLLDVAVRGKLSDPVVLNQQVRRMLADRRAQALVDNFATQWLRLGKLAGVVPDLNVYPEFDENLRDAMLKETNLFFASQLREDRSVIDLLTASYTFVNERLARHYGMPNVYGAHFRRVNLNGGVRGGLLSQASILTVTSYPNRTSPVVRGKWLLSSMLGAPPPPPPPDVPALKDPAVDGLPQSIRERMEVHRANPVCASCHQRMDPLGFSLENFDAIGKWRVAADGAPIDAAASLPDGTQFQGVDGLRTLLVSHQEEFVRTLTEKLLGYAVGRGIEYYDLPAVRHIARDAAGSNYRWSAIIAGITRSAPFTMGIVDSAPSDVSAQITPVHTEIGQR